MPSCCLPASSLLQCWKLCRFPFGWTIRGFDYSFTCWPITSIVCGHWMGTNTRVLASTRSPQSVWLAFVTELIVPGWMGLPFLGGFLTLGYVMWAWRTDKSCVAPVRSFAGSSLILIDWSFAALISGLWNFLSLTGNTLDRHHHQFLCVLVS